MSKIAEKKALKAYPNALIGNLDNLKKDGFIKGYVQALQDVFEWLEKNVPCGEMSHGIVLDVIQECKLHFEGEIHNE